jgi:chromosome partitioning protein
MERRLYIKYNDMARIITVCNNKGGVGKTTTVASLGAGLRLRGYKVLLVDFDGQSNLTETFRVAVPEGCHTYAAMRAKTTPYITPVEVLPQDGQAGALHVLPSNRDLSALEVEMAQQPDRVTRFRTVVDKYRDKYDVIVIDTPPTLGLLTISALYAADEVIITVQPQYLAIRGLITLTDVIRDVEGYKGGALPYTVLFTQYDKRKGLHRGRAEKVEGAGFPVFATRIRSNVALEEAPAAGCDIFTYAKNSNGAKDYDALTAEYLNNNRIERIERL